MLRWMICFVTALVGSPRVLELFRSNRVLKGGQLHWSLVTDSAAQCSFRVFSEIPLSIRMVSAAAQHEAYLMHTVLLVVTWCM